MPKTQSILRRFWKVIGGVAILLTILGSLAQIYQIVDLNQMLLPVYNLLINTIPVYYLFLALFVLFVLFYLIKNYKKSSNILDSVYGRRIAILCQTPRTTQQLRENYELWESQSSWAFIGGHNFDGYIKDLEKQGYVKYINEKWGVTKKALDYIRKYHGG